MQPSCRPNLTASPYPTARPIPLSETTQPTQIGPYVVPKGTLIWPLIYAIQNSVHNWDRVTEFIPVRAGGLCLGPLKAPPHRACCA